MRYGQLCNVIEANRPQRIVEVGTWTGDRAVQMAAEALKYQERVHYTGFDLFEDATDETDAKELNVKKHVSRDDVNSKLMAFRKENPGFSFNLVPGNTRETLPEYDFIKPVDLAFIDGGHSIETIESDYSALHLQRHKHEDGRETVIVLDDYYTERDATEFGCNKLVDGNGEKFFLLPAKDPVLGGGFVQMIQIGGQPPAQKLVVKTRNCVPDEEIQGNIKYFLSKNITMLPECGVHGEEVTFVNGGPDFHKHFDEIRKIKHKIICVKHAHDKLIENGIIPWGCMLLDPRDHVQNFIENPHPEVKYFLASQCHPSTLDRLLKKKATIWGYHAMVGAGEKEIIKDGFMFGGGSTSAMRGISVFYGMGFRKFYLYGFDCCYWPDEEIDREKKDKEGKPKYFECTVNGRKFTTDSENVAQCQDFEKAMKQLTGAEFIARGDGIVPHIWSKMWRDKSNFSEVFNG